MIDSDEMRGLFRVAEMVYKIWEKIPKTKILNQEATINVPESVVEYSIAISVPKNLRNIRRNIEFPYSSIEEISVACLHPLPRKLRNVVSKIQHPDGSTSYVLSPKSLPSDVETISVSVTYHVNEPSLIDDLVERTKAHEPGGPDKNEYWMHACLKHPKVLKNNYGRFDLRDVDVTLNVGIHNELKNTIPASFVRRLRIFFEIMQETDPRRQFRVIPQLRRLARTETAGKEFKILSELELLFYPNEFKRFVEVIKDFRFSGCYRGSDLYDELPIQVIPKSMNVISRTDLTLEKPVAEGTLIYKRDLFIETLKNIMGI